MPVLRASQKGRSFICKILINSDLLRRSGSDGKGNDPGPYCCERPAASVRPHQIKGRTGLFERNVCSWKLRLGQQKLHDLSH